MDLLQKDVPILTKIYEAKCFYDSQNNRITLYYKNHVTGRTLVDFYNLPTTPPPNSSLYVIYDLQTGTFNVSTDPPTYTVSNSKVYVTSPINAEYDMDKVIIYRVSQHETNTDLDLNHILEQLNTFDNLIQEQQENINHILEQLNTFDTFVRKQQADTITATHTFDPTHSGPAFQLGPNARNQLIRYLNADKVDGFDVSQTPAPNVIVPLNADGVLDLSGSYIKSNVYTFRRVDLSNATSDYELQVGEEAIINFTNRTSVPLRIAVGENRFYEIVLQFRVNLRLPGVFTFLNPNNTSYASSFSHVSVYWNSYGGSSWVSYTNTDNGFRLYNQTPHSYIVLDTTRRVLRGFVGYENGSNAAGCGLFVSKWHSNLTTWSSLGTLTFPTSMSGYILIRRLA